MQRHVSRPDRWCMLRLCRALVAANPAVRRNALQLLVDAFPLHDPDASQALHFPQPIHIHMSLCLCSPQACAMRSMVEA